MLEVARVNRVNWRTQLSARVILRKVLPRPPERRVHRINWWNMGTLAEAGDILATSFMALVEGPLPEGVDASNLNVNALRDVDALHVLIQSSNSSSASTNSVDNGRPMIPHFVLPGGIWTVEDLWIAHVTDGGVDNWYTSIGFESIGVSMKEWLELRRHSPNASTAGELLQ